MDTIDESPIIRKERNSFVTIWLILLIAGNSLTALLYLIPNKEIADYLHIQLPGLMMVFMGLFALANVLFAVFLLQWKKFGFYGFCLTSISALILKLILGLGLANSIIGLGGIVILYGILQLKKGNNSAWNELE